MIVNVLKERIQRWISTPFVLVLWIFVVPLIMLIAGPGAFFVAMSIIAFEPAFRRDIYYILPLDRKQMKRRMLVEYGMTYLELFVLVLLALVIDASRVEGPIGERNVWYYTLAFVGLFFLGLSELTGKVTKNYKDVTYFLWVVVTIWMISASMKLDILRFLYDGTKQMLIISGGMVVLAILTLKQAIDFQVQDYVTE